MTANGRGCVKTLFNSKFAANLPDFRKLQLAQALISLKLKFQCLGQVHNSSSSPTFSHSLDPMRTFGCLGKASVWGLSQRPVGVMHFVAGECREKGADYSHPSSRPNAMAVVIVHGVKSARPYLVDLTFV
jgi:hypothetical protein